MNLLTLLEITSLIRMSLQSSIEEMMIQYIDLCPHKKLKAFVDDTRIYNTRRYLYLYERALNINSKVEFELEKDVKESIIQIFLQIKNKVMFVILTCNDDEVDMEMYISWVARLTDILVCDKLDSKGLAKLLISTGCGYEEEWVEYKELLISQHKQMYAEYYNQYEQLRHFFSLSEIDNLFENGCSSYYELYMGILKYIEVIDYTFIQKCELYILINLMISKIFYLTLNGSELANLISALVTHMRRHMTNTVLMHENGSPEHDNSITIQNLDSYRTFHIIAYILINDSKLSFEESHHLAVNYFKTIGNIKDRIAYLGEHEHFCAEKIRELDLEANKRLISVSKCFISCDVLAFTIFNFHHKHCRGQANEKINNHFTALFFFFRNKRMEKNKDIDALLSRILDNLFCLEMNIESCSDAVIDEFINCHSIESIENELESLKSQREDLNL